MKLSRGIYSQKGQQEVVLSARCTGSRASNKFGKRGPLLDYASPVHGGTPKYLSDLQELKGRSNDKICNGRVTFPSLKEIREKGSKLKEQHINLRMH